MPDIDGGEFMRIVRSPLTFPLPAVPVIMLTGHVEREKVVEAVRLGVNEFLCKPVSAKALYERILTIRVKPREMVRIGEYYGPAPRKVAANAHDLADPSEPVWLT
jgi:CheY-like chemotaxis protein